MDSYIKKKINNPYNSSYIDGCFSYLSSQIVDKFKFSNGIKFYGCYLANKNDFRYNLDEDIMYVHNSDFFNKHINKAFYLDEEYKDLFKSFVVNRTQAITAYLYDARYSLFTVVLAGFGRAVSEVGAVIIVGGNIDHLTRVMTTAIALETSKGELSLAMALGIILLLVSLSVNFFVAWIKHLGKIKGYV